MTVEKRIGYTVSVRRCAFVGKPEWARIRGGIMRSKRKISELACNGKKNQADLQKKVTEYMYKRGPVMLV